MKECGGFILVYDLSRPSTFMDVVDFHAQILRNKQQSHLMVKRNVRTPIIIVGNKTDLVGERKMDGGAVLMKQWGCHYYETSAKNGTEVRAAFENIIRQLKCLYEKNLQANNRIVSDDVGGFVFRFAVS